MRVPGRRTAANLLTRDKARRIAANICQAARAAERRAEGGRKPAYSQAVGLARPGLARPNTAAYLFGGFRPCLSIWRKAFDDPQAVKIE
jgi:hypothetical protein